MPYVEQNMGSDYKCALIPKTNKEEIHCGLGIGDTIFLTNNGI